MTASRLLARPMLAAIFVGGPLNALKDAEGHAVRAKPVTDRVVPLIERLGERVGVPVPNDPKTWVRVNAVAQLVAAAGLASGRAPRASAAVLAGTLVPTTLARHRFWDETDPAAKKTQRVQFLKDLSILGGLLIAAGDTDGKPGVVWRTRHAAKDARRAARQETRVLKAKAHLS